MRVRRSGAPAKVEQQMTAMIDVVFQLLTFFVMSFKVATLEGDFSVKMPLGMGRSAASDAPTIPPMKLRMKADAEGNLVSMKLNSNEFGSDGWGGLRDQVNKTLASAGGAGTELANTAEVELDCDYQLKYNYVIKAITYVSGIPDGAGGVIKLVEKIKFSPPKAGPAGG